MAFSSGDHRRSPDDYGTYPLTYPPHPQHPSHLQHPWAPSADFPPPPPYPPFPPRPAHRPPPPYPPGAPARPDTALGTLRTAYRRLRRTLTAALLAYYTVFLCMAAYLPDAMGTAVLGRLNLGVCMGVCVVPLTLATVLLYEATARTVVDPAAHRVRIADAEAREKSAARKEQPR